MKDLKNIIQRFDLRDEIIDITPFGSGHINDTYKLSCRKNNFILQRINHEVFPLVEELCENFFKITRHLQKKNFEYELAVPVLTKENKSWLREENGNCWRIVSFIDDSYSIDLAENKKQVYNAAKAYASYLNSLSDFPINQIEDTIKNFHDLNFRLGQLDEAVELDSQNRLQNVKEELEFFHKRRSLLLEFDALIGTNEIPYRIAHNDTKINNVLFTEESKVVSVIDLDTTMKGIVHYDFGDALRTIANTALEDEKDVSKVSFNIHYFESFLEGYLSKTKNLLTKTEIKHLSLAPILMTYIMGIRFFTDYLHGDVYYKIKYKEHNLVRARVQIALIKSIESQLEKMNELLKPYII